MTDQTAITHAMKILRKEEAIRKTKSEKLKRDYSKNVKKSIKELKYYCKMNGLRFMDVMQKAVELYGKDKEIIN